MREAGLLPKAQAPTASAAAQSSAPAATPIADVSQPTGGPDLVARCAAVSVVMPWAVYNGRLAPPDPIQRQFGGWRGPAIYRSMQQENLALSGACSQYEDRVNKAEQRVRPGIKGDKESEEMARLAAGAFDQLLNPNIITLWLIRAKWYGFTPIGVAGWEKRNGIFAPFDLYNVDPWHFRFGPNFEPYLLTQTDYMGKPVPDGAFFFARWGSLFTAYGESDLRDTYPECWIRQNLRDLMLVSIEQGASMMPMFLLPESMDETEFNTFERELAAKFKQYILFKSSTVSKPERLDPNQTIIANKAAGGSELEAIRYIDGLVDAKILGTQQTKDKTSGSRAQEEVRLEIANDKIFPALQFVNKAWTRGYLDRISMANWATRDRAKWPVMQSIYAPQNMTADIAALVLQLGQQLRMKQITRLFAAHYLIRTGNFDSDEAEGMVDSMLDPEAGLSTAPSAPVPVSGSKNAA